MPLQQPQWTDFLSCANCSNEFSIASKKHPVTLLCGHTICKECIQKSEGCKFDQNSSGGFDISILGVNHPILHLVKYQNGALEKSGVPCETSELIAILGQNYSYYKTAMQHIEGIGMYLKDIRGGIIPQDCEITKPMLRKVVNLVQCQLALEDGRMRLLRACRALGERSATELILAHQNPATLSGHLWTAIRARGCQFLGPAMQEEALKLILLALEDGSELSRKVLVMFVVQKLQQQYQQSSKTSIGHVVQLLYRASCFVVTKREGDSSLMRLKECYRTYPALRKEHDTQIVQIAREAGLRIAPDQWSSLLYGDQDQKSHMQSVIDRLQSKESFERCIQELQALVKINDSSMLSSLIPHFQILSKIDSDGTSSVLQSKQKQDWNLVITCLQSVKFIIQELILFSKTRIKDMWQEEEAMAQSAKYKTSFCRDIKNKGRCPRGDSCTFAHTEEELHWYRSKRKKAGLGHAVREKPLSAQKLQTDEREGTINNSGRSMSSGPRHINQVTPIRSETAAHQASSFMPPRYPTSGSYQPFTYMPRNPYPHNPVPMNNYRQSFQLPDPPCNAYHAWEPHMNYRPLNPHQQDVGPRHPFTSTAPASSSPRPLHRNATSSAFVDQRSSAATHTNRSLPHFTLTVSIQSDQHNTGNPHHIPNDCPPGFMIAPNQQEHQNNQAVQPVKVAHVPNPAPSQVMIHPINQGTGYPMQYMPQAPREENSAYQSNLHQDGPLPSAPRNMNPAVIEPNMPVGFPVETPILRTPTPNFPTPEKQIAIVSPQPIIQSSLPPSHLYDANNGFMYPPGQYQPNIINPVVVAPSPTPMLQNHNVVMMPVPATQPYPIVDPQQNNSSCSPAPSAEFIPNISIPKSIDEATVEQLERRKGKIIHKLIQNQREMKVPESSKAVSRSSTPDLGKVYDVWNSETCASFLINESSPISSYNYPENSMPDEFQTNLVDVVADIDTRTTQVTVRGTDHINPSHSMKERTLDDSRMHKLLVKMNTDLKNSEAANSPYQPLRALIRYSSAPQEDEDEMIPFSDRPIVSKYGPIARSVRTRPSNSDLVQVNSNNDVITHPVAAAIENPTTESLDAVYSSFESPHSVSYFPASFQRDRETLSVQNSKKHPKIPASDMLSKKITPVQVLLLSSLSSHLPYSILLDSGRIKFKVAPPRGSSNPTESIF